MELSGECSESIVMTNMISINYQVTCSISYIAYKLLYKIITRINLRASNFQNFPGGNAPDPPSINMLHILIVLCTIWVASQFLQLPL